MEEIANAIIELIGTIDRLMATPRLYSYACGRTRAVSVIRRAIEELKEEIEDLARDSAGETGCETNKPQ